MRLKAYGLIPGEGISIVQGKQSEKVTVIKEYPHFILVQKKNYREAINKTSLHCRSMKIERAKEQKV